MIVLSCTPEHLPDRERARFDPAQFPVFPYSMIELALGEGKVQHKVSATIIKRSCTGRREIGVVVNKPNVHI